MYLDLIQTALNKQMNGADFIHVSEYVITDDAALRIRPAIICLIVYLICGFLQAFPKHNEDIILTWRPLGVPSMARHRGLLRQLNY